MEIVTISLAILFVAAASFLFLCFGFMMGIQNEEKISSQYFADAEKYKSELKTKNEKIEYLEKANEELADELKHWIKKYEEKYIELDAMKAKNISRYANIGI